MKLCWALGCMYGALHFANYAVTGDHTVSLVPFPVVVRVLDSVTAIWLMVGAVAALRIKNAGWLIHP